MKNYNRTLLTKEQFDAIKPQILSTFREFVPRTEFVTKNTLIKENNINSLDSMEQPNMMSYPTSLSPHLLNGVDSFDDVFKFTEVYHLLKDKFECIQDYVNSCGVTKATNTFITFSTNITGASIAIKHLHTLLNGDCCNVWSFAVPLYIDTLSTDTARFWYNSQSELYPRRYYVDYNRIKKMNINYTNISLPKDGHVLSIMFDGARSPHYIDYTNHLYAFVVFDGINVESPLGKKFITELL
jgi:hypothetical protein